MPPKLGIQFGDGFAGGGFDIGDCQLKQLVCQIRQCPSECQFVADGGHRFVGWVESCQTDTNQLVALP